MKLKSVKLAGFKTFVDPTKIPLQSNLVAILGPNGCGKSNIIDAVRWVMGESSAKQLRGEAASDVVFNGSAARKPVGQASVELVFDNVDGSLGGLYAQYAEIAIKRQVSRDGQSIYYLNGTRCRRRDIVDIFLGTGLGPRSYAIIEQGTISRLIEAKPDELRAHIEEAAGISKYKERRRETEMRMQHTRDNLQRLSDIREEISKQLERLQKQAQIAEKYREFKQQERLLKAQLIASRWQILSEEIQVTEKIIQEHERHLSDNQAKLSQYDSQFIELQELQYTNAEQVKLIETNTYAAKNTITKLEQSLQYQQQRITQLNADLQEATKSLNSIKLHQQQDTEQVEALIKQRDELSPKLEQAQAIVTELEEQLIDAEQQQKDVLHSWDKHLAEMSRHTQAAQVQQTKIQHIERTWQNSEQRVVKLSQELDMLDDSSIAQQIEEMLYSNEEQANKQLQLAEQLSDTQALLIAKRASYHNLNKDLQHMQQRLQQLAAQHASLQTIQQEALGKQQHNNALSWLQEYQLTELPRLAEKISVAPEWELAVEVVLNRRLQAIGVNNLDELVAEVHNFATGSITLLAINHSVQEPADSNLLASKVQSSWPISNLLAGVYIASNLDKAWQQLTQLKDHESIILPDGTWLGPGWLHVQRTEDSNTGLLLRERTLRQLAVEIEVAEQQISELEQTVTTTQIQLHELEEQRDYTQQSINEGKSHTAKLQAQLEIKQARLREVQQRSKTLGQDISELKQQQAQLEVELQTARQLWQAALESIEQYDKHQEQLKIAKDKAIEKLQAINQQLKQAQTHYHQLKVHVQTVNVQAETKQQHLARLKSQCQEQSARCENLKLQLEKASEPVPAIKEEIQLHCEKLISIEEQLNEARAKLQVIDSQLKELDKSKHIIEHQIQGVRTKLEEERLARQTAIVRRQAHEEQLVEQKYQLTQIEHLLNEQSTPELLEVQLEKMTKRIQALGAINLAAIEEYQVETERKQHLDAQYSDLVSALTTLQDAIRKIDQETRSRFQVTLERVNQGLQNLFPKLFGGGQAYLELTSEDLLMAGVNIMARPPGKRNSTIHLLSGGEKALTAVALVFAIFQLNPAPFCILDEVDAPLDDANVARFCNLLKVMADKVQFLFITHNKLTMETAEQLIGVTMREPGISRLVAVDIGDALQLAEP